MSVNKFQVLITIDRNSLSIPKVFYDTTEINDLLKLDEDIFNFLICILGIFYPFLFYF